MNSQKIPNEFWKNSQRISQKFPKKSKKILKNSPDFENIQFPTSHLGAKNPFGLVLFLTEEAYSHGRLQTRKLAQIPSCNPRELMYPFKKVYDVIGSKMTRCMLMQVMVNLLKQLFSYLEKKYQSIRSTYLLS
jgi:hypothetical protein